ncbi:flagellar basal body-associated protein FliL [Parahaliea mediterranea]|uniref:flagellar basal body-associated protein FliL n=1 Tax=Parahaliea mediterranea TaxID=651086 RepID=UPI000E2EEA78|nr:flagellar basal body-associated protein FliL [Parahaliea mediterranea]
MANTQGDSRKMWWLVIALLFITTGLAATNIYLLTRQGESGASEEVAEVSESGPPIFVDIAPFTVNLQTDGYGNRLLYAGVSLQVGDEATRDFLTQHMPQLRSRLLTLFSGQEAAELISTHGKQQLVAGVMDLLREPMAQPQPELAVRNVLFTEFIVQ